jgi:phosphate transport system substrate-binding protein
MPGVSRGSAASCARTSKQADRRHTFTNSNARMTQLVCRPQIRLAFRFDLDWEEVLQVFRKFAAIGLLLAAAMAAARAADISGAGATFPYPIYAKWADAYKKETGITVNYQPLGSGEGIRMIQNKEVVFGTSEMPLKAADLDLHGLVQFPTLIGGVVVVVNLDGVKPGGIVLDGSTLAKIFLGEISSWNDRALRKLNPGVKLPSQAIAVVHRSDGSGTTFVFTNYLSRMNTDWKSRVGAITSVDWPAGTGARVNEGVVASVARTKDSIGYVEYAYAKQANLSTATLMNRDRKAVAPNIESFTAAARNANWEGTPGFGVILSNGSGADAWPMASATFVLMRKQPTDPVAAGEALKFFNWAYTKGGRIAEELDYVPMPANVVNAVRKLWASEIKDASGKPIFVLSN